VNDNIFCDVYFEKPEPEKKKKESRRLSILDIKNYWLMKKEINMDKILKNYVKKFQGKNKDQSHSNEV
jgi:hypothetical protein